MACFKARFIHPPGGRRVNHINDRRFVQEKAKQSRKSKC
jgi:hypothetical protein